MLTAKDFIVAGFTKIDAVKRQKIFVKEIIKHPSYNFFNNDNDIAILKVALHYNPCLSTLGILKSEVLTMNSSTVNSSDYSIQTFSTMN